jgi:hypothetical protein
MTFAFCVEISNNYKIVNILFKFYWNSSSAPFLGLGRSSSFLILYTVGRTPWTVDQPVASSLPRHRTTQTQNKHTDYPSIRADLDRKIISGVYLKHTSDLFRLSAFTFAAYFNSRIRNSDFSAQLLIICIKRHTCL